MTKPRIYADLTCCWEGCTENTVGLTTPWCPTHAKAARAVVQKRYRMRKAGVPEDQLPFVPAVCQRCGKRRDGKKYCTACVEPARRTRQRLYRQAQQVPRHEHARKILSYVVSELDKMRIGIIPVNGKRLEALGRILLQVKVDTTHASQRQRQKDI